jgi:hypothetical protein
MEQQTEKNRGENVEIMVKRASKRLYSLMRVKSYSGVPSRHLLLFGELNPCV